MLKREEETRSVVILEMTLVTRAQLLFMINTGYNTIKYIIIILTVLLQKQYMKCVRRLTTTKH